MTVTVFKVTGETNTDDLSPAPDAMCRTNAAAGVVLGSKIAPILFNTMEDAGALPTEVDVSDLNIGDVIDIYPFAGEIRHHETGARCWPISR